MLWTGTLEDGSAYQVSIPADGSPMTGSRRVQAMVEQYAGAARPLGPQRTLDPADADAALARLRQKPQVAEVKQ